MGNKAQMQQFFDEKAGDKGFGEAKSLDDLVKKKKVPTYSMNPGKLFDGMVDFN